MFEDSNRIRFEVRIEDVDKAWWKERFFDTHGLTPEAVGEALSASWAGERQMTVRRLDGLEQVFQIEVSGDLGNGAFWLHDRMLDMHGNFLSAEKMFISPSRQQEGMGRGS